MSERKSTVEQRRRRELERRPGPLPASGAIGQTRARAFLERLDRAD
jgi:hypothetical protein